MAIGCGADLYAPGLFSAQPGQEMLPAEEQSDVRSVCTFQGSNGYESGSIVPFPLQGTIKTEMMLSR